MSSDPGKSGSDDPGGGDPGDIDQGEKKTRFVPRPDLAGRPPAAAPAPADSDIPAPAGTVIGRTRLIGSHGQLTQAGGGAESSTPNMRMGSAKTELIRGGGIESEPVAGWVVVVKGPGRGGFSPVFVGMNSVGRDPSQRVSLSFGDESISREEHAFITYDEETRCFYLQHGGKSNLVRLGSDPVLTPTELKPNDLIRIGKTTLLFIPCCGPDFSWTDEVHNA
jgi:hypothetical protein